MDMEMEMGRPGRSDEHLPPQEEARIEAQARDYFDKMAPKRHTKPSRSDSDSNTLTLLVHSDSDNAPIPIPELAKFQDLQAHSHSEQIMSQGDASKPAEEYTATPYYEDLNCIDKHHHTTGSGFIQMEDSNPHPNRDERYFEIASDSNSNQHPSNSNPATNDWIPSAQTQTVILASNKPTRSGN